jgi:hypothetical protein
MNELEEMKYEIEMIRRRQEELEFAQWKREHNLLP